MLLVHCNGSGEEEEQQDRHNSREADTSDSHRTTRSHFLCHTGCCISDAWNLFIGIIGAEALSVIQQIVWIPFRTAVAHSVNLCGAVRPVDCTYPSPSFVTYYYSLQLANVNDLTRTVTDSGNQDGDWNKDLLVLHLLERVRANKKQRFVTLCTLFWLWLLWKE